MKWCAIVENARLSSAVFKRLTLSNGTIRRACRCITGLPKSIDVYHGRGGDLDVEIWHFGRHLRYGDTRSFERILMTGVKLETEDRRNWRIARRGFILPNERMCWRCLKLRRL